MPSRRRVLAALGATAGVAVGLAGCAESTGESTDRIPNTGSATTGSPTPSATGAPERTPAGMGATQQVGESEVTVSTPRVQSSIVHHSTPDSMDVTTTDGRFVLVEIGATDPALPRDAVSLVTAGEEHGPTEIGFGPSVVVDGGLRREYYAESDAEGWLVFEVPPQGSPPEPRIACRDVAWHLPDVVGDALAQPSPEWKLRSFAVPDELRPGEEFEARFAVENVGDVDATFRGALNVANLNYAYYPYPFGVDVAAGKRAAWSKVLSVPAGYGDGSPDFYLRTPTGSRSEEAEVGTETATPK